MEIAATKRRATVRYSRSWVAPWEILPASSSGVFVLLFACTYTANSCPAFRVLLACGLECKLDKADLLVVLEL